MVGLAVFVHTSLFVNATFAGVTWTQTAEAAPFLDDKLGSRLRS